MKCIYTIGYGNRNIEDFVKIIKSYDIYYLIDIRSIPHSKFNPEFSKTHLKKYLTEINIKYVFMGDSLGGRPNDKFCYTDGKVSYNLVQKKEFFQKGIKRLQVASSKNIKVCLMCSELKPELCHRSKLIGDFLDKINVEIYHIDYDGKLFSQKEVEYRLNRGQQDLFENCMMSNKVYKI